MLAIRLNYVTKEHAQPALNLLTEVGKMLTSLRNHLKE